MYTYSGGGNGFRKSVQLKMFQVIINLNKLINDIMEYDLE